MPELFSPLFVDGAAPSQIHTAPPVHAVHPSLVELPTVRRVLDLAALTMLSVAAAATTSFSIATLGLLTVIGARVALRRSLTAR
ncbi:hypothetical protein ACNJ7E_22175 [Rhodococcus sp. NM-2]|uniref:Uncharacterized protein n=1 Tax=Rhodococcus jostii TaxID=132919 RepID=A0ABU4CRY9_RHOJO|nr:MULTISPECIES: hypothetical protein [Rhodococcus]MDI9975847.1 hypothetical protein [Rhodococcus sp. IEGM 1307]MDV6286347.1 hypothetical protein [Rhodococcus jostii]